LLSEANLALSGLGPSDVQALRERQALERDDLLGKNGDSRAVETQDRESGKMTTGPRKSVANLLFFFIYFVCWAVSHEEGRPDAFSGSNWTRERNGLVRDFLSCIFIRLD